jgi:nucleoside-diphosphate-sugar epimerase
MRILIAGASGFLGTTIFNALQVKYEVYGLAIDKNIDKVFNCDLIDLENTKNVLAQNGILKVDVLIHLAAILADKDNLNDIGVLNKNNILSKNIAFLASHLNAKKIINFSSSSVYPNIDGEFNENSKVDPTANTDAIYGLSKFNSEVIINKFSESDKLITHLRSVMVYGKGVNPTRIWPVMEQELMQKNTITVFGSGKRLINQIHMSSLITVLEKFIINDYPGVYNISDETISMKDLALRIIKEKGNKDSKVIEVEKGNTFQFVVNADKYKALK